MLFAFWFSRCWALPCGGRVIDVRIQDVGRIKPQRDAPDTIEIYEIRFFATHIQVFDGSCGLQKAIFWALRTTGA